jgi:hypothetical protein
MFPPSADLKMQGTGSSKTSVPVHQSTWHHTLEDTAHNNQYWFTLGVSCYRYFLNKSIIYLKKTGSSIIYTVVTYDYIDEIKEDEMGKSCSMHLRAVHKVLVGKPKRKRPLERPESR